MTFEALTPMRLITKTLGSVALKTAQRLTWPDEAVQQLLAKVPEKIRVVEESNQLRPGVWLEFFSPLFGMCSAKVQRVEVDGVWLTHHSVTKDSHGPCKIPASWICGISR